MESLIKQEAESFYGSILSRMTYHILREFLKSDIDVKDIQKVQQKIYHLQDQQLKKFLDSPSCMVQSDEEMKRETFSICGICTSRDYVTILGNRVNRFIQDVNPISLYFKSPAIEELPFTKDSIHSYLKNDENQFNIRNVILDANKEAYSYLFEVKSDWLILDAGCLRIDLLADLDHRTAVTKFLWNKLNLSLDRERYQLISTNSFSESDFEKYMTDYLDHMLKFYDEEKIIVTDFHMAQTYVDAQRKRLHIFGHDCDKGNRAISRGFHFMQSRLPKAHFIPFLDNAIGDESHKWGMYPLHYVYECYEYGAEAIRIIQKRFAREKEQALIEELKAYYQNKIAFHYLTFLQDADNMLPVRSRSVKQPVEWMERMQEALKSIPFIKENTIAAEAPRIPFLYAMVRLLEACHPQRILEFGFDGATKVAMQYADFTSVHHVVFDWNRNRVMKMLNEWKISIRHTEICGSDPIPVRRQEQDAIIYPAFLQRMQQHQETTYDFILLKRSLISPQKKLPSLDIMPHMPQLLARNFVILVDFADKNLERMTIDDIQSLLKDHGIDHRIRVLSDGTQDACVIISKEWAEMILNQQFEV